MIISPEEFDEEATSSLPKDWHQADIIAAMKKKGFTLASLSRKSGLNSSTLANALTRTWPKGEIIIARSLQLRPCDIWPSRYYHGDNTPKKERLDFINSLEIQLSDILTDITLNEKV